MFLNSFLAHRYEIFNFIMASYYITCLNRTSTVKVGTIYYNFHTSATQQSNLITVIVLLIFLHRLY